jgi:hypothetical protein
MLFQRGNNVETVAVTAVLAIDHDAAIAAKEAEIERLREALHAEREMHRHRAYPEPFKVGAVLGRSGNMSYALQILHVWNNWPTVDIEVSLPPSAALGVKHE